MSQDESKSDGSPCVLILAPTVVELLPTVVSLELTPNEDHHTGQIGSMKIIAAVCGMGGEPAAANAQRWIERCKPTRLLLTGYAGALDPQLDIGFLINVGEIVNEQGDSIALPSESKHRLLTVDRVIETSEEKARLFEKSGATIVDMEAFAIAKVAEQFNLPFAVTRSISDRADEALPAWTMSLVTDEGKPRIMFAALMCIAMPWRIGTLKRLDKNSKIASETLEYANRGTIEQWAQQTDESSDR